MSSENMLVVRRWFEELWNQRNATVIDELLTDESVCYGEGEPLIGIEAFKTRQYIPLMSAFPDLVVSVDDMVADGDRVVVRWSASATHCGDGIGCSPTREKATFSGMSWIVVRDGKFREGWQVSNIAQVVQNLQQLAASS